MQVACGHARSKNRSKNAVSLSITVCFLAPRFEPFANRETGGRIVVMAVPVARTRPSRNAASMKARVWSGLRASSVMIRSSSASRLAAT